MGLYLADLSPIGRAGLSLKLRLEMWPRVGGALAGGSLHSSYPVVPQVLCGDRWSALVLASGEGLLEASWFTPTPCLYLFQLCLILVCLRQSLPM